MTDALVHVIVQRRNEQVHRSYFINAAHVLLDARMRLRSCRTDALTNAEPGAQWRASAATARSTMRNAYCKTLPDAPALCCFPPPTCNDSNAEALSTTTSLIDATPILIPLQMLSRLPPARTYEG